MKDNEIEMYDILDKIKQHIKVHSPQHQALILGGLLH